MTLTVKIKGDAGLIIDEMREEFEPAMARAVFGAAHFAGGKLAEVSMAVFPKSTGRLGSSFMPPKFIATGKNVAAGALSTLPHADILDRGGTIKPRTVKMLAIPLSKKAKKLWPREWPKGELVRITSKKGNVLLVTPKGKGGMDLHYLLKKSVDITGRGYIERAREEAEPDVAEIVAEEMEVTFDAVPGVEQT